MYQTLSEATYTTLNNSYQTMRGLLAAESGAGTLVWCEAMRQANELQRALTDVQCSLRQAETQAFSARMRALRAARRAAR